MKQTLKATLVLTVVLSWISSIVSLECPEGQTDPGSNVCTDCSTFGCSNCDGDVSVCQKCKEGRFLVYDFGRWVCGYCPSNCKECSSNTECTTCIDGYEKSEDHDECKSLDTYPFRYVLIALLIPLALVLLFLAICCYNKANSERLSNKRLKIQQLRASKEAKERRLKYLREDPHLV